MMRFLLILTLLLIILWLGRSVLEDLRQLSKSRRRKNPGPFSSRSSSPHLPVTDKLVRDPVCGVYCPKKTALTAIWKGKVYYFCSEECRQKFLQKHASASSSG